MAKSRAKMVRVGVGAFINRDGAKGMSNWERVGTLFYNHGEARAYVAKEYPNVKKSRIQTIRVPADKIGGCWADRAAEKTVPKVA